MERLAPLNLSEKIILYFSEFVSPFDASYTLMLLIFGIVYRLA